MPASAAGAMLKNACTLNFERIYNASHPHGTANKTKDPNMYVYLQPVHSSKDTMILDPNLDLYQGTVEVYLSLDRACQVANACC